VYPNLLAPLLAALAVVLVGVLLVAIFQPVSRRLARRQLARRRSEAVLAIVGATLGTSIIVGALVVGDTLNFSVRQEAYRTLGPIDERVVSAGTGTGDRVAGQLADLAGTRDVDGVLSGRVAEAAAVSTKSTGTAAEPRVLAWDLDLASAATFGSTSGNSGLGGRTRPPERRHKPTARAVPARRARGRRSRSTFTVGPTRSGSPGWCRSEVWPARASARRSIATRSCPRACSRRPPRPGERSRGR
jgi:putative ABC transport system permease protein